jgi:Ca-activated chloride channel family protein
MNIQFAEKIYLLLLLIIPVLIVWERILQKKGKHYVNFSSKQLFPWQHNTLRIFFIKNINYFKMAVVLLFIIALARPQLVNYFSLENKKGMDILIALDISGSMASIDFKPKNRLEVAKEVIGDFIEKRVTDRLGLVIFAGNSYTKCPLTIDYDILKYFLSETNIGDMEDGTAIGMALATSVNRIRNSKSKTKVIILLTDGVNNRGEIDPKDAAKIARDFNVKVYTIGVGIRGQADFPITDSFGNIVRYIPVNVEIDEELLRHIANSTGGLYFRATDKDSLQKIFQEIDQFEKTEISTRQFANVKDLFHYFLLIALGMLFIIELLKRSFLRFMP